MQILKPLRKARRLSHVFYVSFLFIFAGIQTFLVVCVGDFCVFISAQLKLRLILNSAFDLFLTKGYHSLQLFKNNLHVLQHFSHPCSPVPGPFL